MTLERAVVGALSHAELVDLVIRQSMLIDQLQAALADQGALIARLEGHVRDLERQLAQRDQDDPSRRMPGLKPATTPRRRKDGPRQPRAAGFSRPHQEPTEQVVHALERCPRCQSRLAGGWVAWRKQVLELPPAPLRVIEHVYVRRRCPNPRCRATVSPAPVPAAELGVPGGRQRLGLRLVSLVAALRAELRLPLESIGWYLQTVHGLELSQGAIVGAVRRLATAGQGAVERIRQRIRRSPVVCADETGLRQDGSNGYLWSFSTPRERYFVRAGRNKEVVDEVLGEHFAGVLVTDFYAAYDHYLGPHQRCWAHLLRDIHHLLERHPQDTALQAWATAVHGVYNQACRTTGDSPAQRQRTQRQCEALLLALCEPWLQTDAAVAPQAVLCRRIAKYLPELFSFVADPRVPSTNNAAERSVRPVVVQRKISGGTRSEQGTTTFTTLATLFGTWKARGLDPLVACHSLLLPKTTAHSPL